MTEDEAYEVFRDWAAEHGLDREAIGGNGWVAAAHKENIWVIGPPSRNNTLFVVTATTVRPVSVGWESLDDVLKSMETETSKSFKDLDK